MGAIRIFQNEKGLTLASLLVACLTLSIVGVVIATFVSSSAGFFSGVDKSNRINDIVIEVRRGLSFNRGCPLNLKDVILQSREAGGVAVNKISGFDRAGNPINQILQTGDRQRGLTISGLRLFSGPKLNSGAMAAVFEITFQKNANSNELIKRELPLFVIAEDNKVKDCWVSQDHSALVYNQFCAAISSGGANTYDPETKKCVLANGKWISGSLNSASCPSGYTLPTGASSSGNCRPRTSDGWVDTAPSMDYQLSNGSTQSFRRSPARVILNAANSSCTCDWATDIPSSDLSNFRCEILCLAP